MVDCVNKICSVCYNECQMCDVEYQCIECEHLENNKDLFEKYYCELI